MKKPETKFKEAFLKKLRSIPLVWAEKIQQVALRGTPDILCCVAGIFVAIELKDLGEEMDPLQTYKCELIRNAGGYYFVATKENCFQVLSEIKKIVESNEGNMRC